MNFTVNQSSWFMEVWLSPALGFDYANAEARIYGPGTSPINRDVAEICTVSRRHAAAERKTIEFGGPEALTPHEVVGRFETIGGTRFRVKSFAALMLGYWHGDAMEMTRVVETFGIKLSTVDDYARGVLGKTASA